MRCQSIIIAAAASFASLVAAQADTGLPPPWNECCNLTNPSAVETSTRTDWCQAQYNSCNSLCNNNVLHNDCDATALTYNCQCYQAKTPNISDYAQTLPSLVCQEWSSECNEAQTGNSSAQQACQNVNCGTKNASEADSSSSGSSGSSSSSSSMSSSPSSTSSTGSQSTGSSPSASSGTAAPSTGAAMPVTLSREASTGIVGAILFGVFGFLL